MSHDVEAVSHHDYRVVDTDAHYIESIDDLVSYMDEPWKTRLEKGGEASKSFLLPKSSGDRTVFGRISRDHPYGYEGNDPEDAAEIMDYLGVDASIQLTQLLLAFARLKADDDRAAVLAKAYNDYMLDQVVDPDAGVYTTGVIPYQDPAVAVEEIDRIKHESGIVGFMMVTGGAEPPFGNREYEPIYEAVERSGKPIVFHTGGSGLDEFYLTGYEKLIETHTLGFLMNNMAQTVSLIVQGIPVKFPDLDIVFLESGIFYIPLLMSRLDAEYRKRPSEAPLLEKPPSAYLQEMYFGTQPIEEPPHPDHLKHVIEMIGGPERLMYASDYPHWDFDPPSTIADLPFLSKDDKQQILAGTAEEVFGI